MSDPLKPNDPPEDVLPYAPSWVRGNGYRASQQPGVSYDAFSDEENPSYRSMAQMFAPQQPDRSKRKNNATARMLVRFGAVVGAAGVALALFVGYIASRSSPEADSANAERFQSVSNAVAAIQAALTPNGAPAAKPTVRTVETSAVTVEPPAPAAPERPADARLAANPDSGLSTDRGAAPEAPPPVDTNLVPEPQAPAAAEPQSPPQVAALPPKEEAPAPAPERIAPQLSAGELATLMSKGRRFVEMGDFSSARPVYRRAAEAGYAEAALALGETYDPITLEERGVVGMNPNVEEARHWYERARELGSLEAPTRLERLARY